jgi:glycosyltransferase involved in cell wall biosynthesis
MELKAKVEKGSNMKSLVLSVIFPCLNEIETLGICIKDAQKFLDNSGVEYEIIVSDNGSVDGSQELAISLGARLIYAPSKGYGNALRAGIESAKGKYVIFLDADGSYSLEDVQNILKLLEAGNDLVMGNRFLGGIEAGAMPHLHKYFGNPVLSWLGRRLFQTTIGDFHCGLRGFRKEAFKKLNLNSEGMEFASEIVVKSVLGNLKITETPVKLYRDKRSRAPHLRSFPDGWRHLKFLFAFAPNSLFLVPGIALIIFGLFIMIPISIASSVVLDSVVFGMNSLIISSISICIGASFLSCYGLTREFANSLGVELVKDSKKDQVKQTKSVADKYIFFGFFMMLVGFVIVTTVVLFWVGRGFEISNSLELLRITIPAMTMTIVGSEIFVAGLISMIFNAFSVNRKSIS